MSLSSAWRTVVAATLMMLVASQIASAQSTQPAPATMPAGDGITETIHRASLAWMDAAPQRVDALLPAAQAAADKLLAGGKLYFAGNPGFVSENVNRAGGFMFAQEYKGETIEANDVVIIGRFMPNEPEPFTTKLVDVVGCHNRFANGTVIDISSHDTPGVQRLMTMISPRWQGRLFMIDTAAPVGGTLTDMCVQQLATVATAWELQGEIMSAATRKGKMLAVDGSDYQPGEKELQKRLGNRHVLDDFNVPAVAAGAMARAYLRDCRDQIYDFGATQAKQVRVAAQRLAACMKRGGVVWLVTSGHVHDEGGYIPPQLDRVMRLGRSWQFENLHKRMTGGDILLWIGYIDYPRNAVAMTDRAGSEAVVVSNEAGPASEKVTQILGCWKAYDCIVELQNYPTKLLASSGTVQTPQWYSIMAETVAVYKK